MADPITRARSVERLLGNEELQFALQRIEDTAIGNWKASDSTPEEREKAWMIVQAVQQFRVELAIVLDSGAHEADRLERERRRANPI